MPKLSICILARKNLSRNTRVARQAKVLAEAGHKVVVVCLVPPSPEIIKSLPGVEFIALTNLDPVTQRLARCLNRIIGFGKKIIHAIEKTFSRLLRGCVALLLSPLALAFLLLFKLQNPKVPFREMLSRERGWNLLGEFLSPYSLAAMNIEFAKKAEQALADREFDRCQAHDAFALRAAERVAKNSNARLIYDAVEIPDDRSGWRQSGMPKLVRLAEARVEERIIKKMDRIMTVSPGIVDWTAKRYHVEKPDLIRNFRLYEEIEPNRRIKDNLALNPDDILILYLNSLYQGQGLEQLIQAHALLPDNFHTATLGPWPQPGFRQAMTELIAQTGRADSFHILEPVDPSLMLSLASGADIGIIPRQNTSLNNWFSLPNRVFEMVMARLPIACCSLKDMSDFVLENDLGMTFDQTNPKDIARIIQLMAQPQTLTRLKHNIARAAKQMCWENEGRRYLELIEKG